MSRLSLLISLALPVCAWAEPVQFITDNHALLENSGSAYQGVMSINQAAGDRQQQANGRALAIGSDARANFQQYQTLDDVDAPMDAQSSIRGKAFSNGAGVLGINQSSGSGTQQINVFRTSIGARAENLDDSILAQQSVVLSQDSGAAESSPGKRVVDIDNQAFAGSSGVVQLNQSAGVGNQTANTISIRVMD